MYEVTAVRRRLSSARNYSTAVFDRKDLHVMLARPVSDGLVSCVVNLLYCFARETTLAASRQFLSAL